MEKGSPGSPNPPPPPVRSKDANDIQAFIKLVKSGEETKDHRCASVGQIIFERKNGRKSEIMILPGHNADRYEFRHRGKIFSVPRDEFITALKNLGVKRIPE